MSAPTLEPSTRADPNPPALSWLLRSRPLGLAMASAVALWASFLPVGLAPAAWLGLVPLFLLVEHPGRPRAIYGSALAAGFVFWILAIGWVQLAEPGPESWLAVALMALVLGSLWPLSLFLVRRGVHSLGWPILAVAPLVWLAQEYLRAYLLTGLPWYYLAHSQYRVLPIIQVADLAGAWGLSLLIAMVNALTASTLVRWARGQRPAWGQVGLAAALVAGSLLYGTYRRNSAEFRPGPKLALLQSNIRQERQNRDPEFTFFSYQKLVRQAMEGDDRPDLIVWSETSFPYNYIRLAPNIPPAELDRQVKAIHPRNTADGWTRWAGDSFNLLHPWVDRLGVPMMIGTTLYDHRPDGFGRYNAAILIEPGRSTIQEYSKIHLVPFGEYVPLIETVPAIRMFTPYRDDYIPNLNFGPGPRWIDFQGLRIAVAICFEDTVPQVVGPLMRDTPDRQPPDLLINQSNDGWFYGSSEHRTHLAISVFRAVEYRVPLARSVNTGISAMVDGNGRILAEVPETTEGVLHAVVPLDDRDSLYRRTGDWLPILASGFSLFVLPGPFLVRRFAAHRDPGSLPRTI